jgi:GTP-binding protein
VLARRPQVVVGNKIDAVSQEDVNAVVERFSARGIELLPISVATGENTRDLVFKAFSLLQGLRQSEHAEPAQIRRKVYRFEGETGFTVEREDDVLVVRGRTVENLVKKLVLDSFDAQQYLGDRLEKMGVMKELRRHGWTEGDMVLIGEIELELAR